mmetsp:Transcript_40995/g.124213  ORF Transcript_40995/g.124213 Transcript_40995/m.124213 type:complete len:227 (-) Transcript_40995:518-1198(-)
MPSHGGGRSCAAVRLRRWVELHALLGRLRVTTGRATAVLPIPLLSGVPRPTVQGCNDEDLIQDQCSVKRLELHFRKGDDLPHDRHAGQDLPEHGRQGLLEGLQKFEGPPLEEGQRHQHLHADKLQEGGVALEKGLVGALDRAHAVDRCHRSDRTRGRELRVGVLKAGLCLRGCKGVHPAGPTGLQDADHDKHPGSQPELGLHRSVGHQEAPGRAPLLLHLRGLLPM